MKLVGLTGNIGSGKSTAASFFRELDYVVIGADLLAREVLQKKEVIEEVVASFGEQVLIQGKIQPTLLAKIVFHNKENVEKMNAISHPRIQEMSLTKIKELYQKNEGKELFLPPNRVKDWDGLIPQYKSMEGWQKDTYQIKSFSKLPKNCAIYINFLQKSLNLPIIITSVSPRREDSLIRKTLFLKQPIKILRQWQKKATGSK